MTALESDLAPVYGPPAALASGASRATLLELMTFHRKALAVLGEIVPGCVRCDHKSGRNCKKFNAQIPVNYDGSDCPEWAFDGIEF